MKEQTTQTVRVLPPPMFLLCSLRFPVTFYFRFAEKFPTHCPYAFFTFSVGTGAGPQRFFKFSILV